MLPAGPKVNSICRLSLKSPLPPPGISKNVSLNKFPVDVLLEIMYSLRPQSQFNGGQTL